MDLKLNRQILFNDPGDRAFVDDVGSGTVGRPVRMHKDDNGNVIAFDMIFYGYPRVFTTVRAQDLDMV